MSEPPRRRAADQSWWVRNRPLIGYLILAAAMTGALADVQYQRNQACASGNKVRLALRTIIQQSYDDAIAAGQVPPERRAAVRRQERHYLELAADQHCPGFLPG